MDENKYLSILAVATILLVGAVFFAHTETTNKKVKAKDLMYNRAFTLQHRLDPTCHIDAIARGVTENITVFDFQCDKIPLRIICESRSEYDPDPLCDYP